MTIHAFKDMKSAEETVTHIHQAIEDWRPGEREWEEVKAIIQATMNESFDEGWKQGMIDAQDMLSKGIDLSRATQPFNSAT